MNWLDLGIILFVVIIFAVGIKRGFMKSILSHFSLGINCLISLFLYQPVKWIFTKLGLYGAIASRYANGVLSSTPSLSENLLTLSKSELGSFVKSGINESGLSKLSKLMFRWFLKTDNLYDTLHSSETTSRTLSDIISNTYANFFTTIIAFVTCILLLYFLVFIFKKLADNLRKVGFVKFVDGALGAVYGAFKCLIVAIILCLVIKLLSPLGFMEGVTNYISESFFGKLIYNQVNNLIDTFIQF